MTGRPRDGTIAVSQGPDAVGDGVVAVADERARRLAEEARPFLEAEGFSNRRIDELARAFVARGLGGDDEFTAWALAEGWYEPRAAPER
jgi:hypothetical protein